MVLCNELIHDRSLESASLCCVGAVLVTVMLLLLLLNRPGVLRSGFLARLAWLAQACSTAHHHQVAGASHKSGSCLNRKPWSLSLMAASDSGF